MPGAAIAADERFGGAAFARASLRKIFPDHWSFLLGEIALYSFVLLVLTGIFLTLFFEPSMADITYHGSYVLLRGVRMSEAYASTLRISFDIRGGLLMRQLHHWAALLFVAAIVVHMSRIFFTGAFRKPRELNWLIGLTMFALAIAEGFFGYSLPDDLMSGIGLRIAEGIVQSVPILGTYLAFFAFGGPFPGESYLPRMYIAHVLLIPGLLVALITAHLMILWHQGHTQWPGKKERADNEVGVPLYPIFLAKTAALLFFTFAALALASAFTQINPVWLFGPYNPVQQSSDSQPDWYMGFLEGALRLMPGWQTVFAGHTLAWNVFVPAVLLPIGFFAVSGLYPFFEAFATGDRRHHQVLDRPRNEPTRTALGVAVVAMWLDLLAAGSDDLIAFRFRVPVEGLIWVFRVGFFAFPLVAFAATRRICVALQRRDKRELRRGRGAGTIVTAPEGGFAIQAEPVSEERRAVLAADRPRELISAIPRHVVPVPSPARLTAQVTARLNRFYTGYRQETISSASADGQAGAQAERPGGEHD